MKAKTILYLIYFLSFIYIVKTIKIYLLTNSENGGKFSYDKLIYEFNKYSVHNNLNITLKMNLLTKDNSTFGVTDYESSMEHILSKGSNKYDLFFFDNIYTNKFGPYLLNLDDYITKEHIDMYNNETLQTCYYKDKLVALPYYFDVTALYYNEKLLNKYKREVPRTWNELINTGAHILNNERSLNNTNLVGYNGLLDDSEIGTCSIYEFIYTYRDHKSSPFPGLSSQNAEKALMKLKQIKNEISSDYIFKSDIYYTFESIFKKQFIFAKLWYRSKFHDDYNYAILPGRIEGISGSTIGGYNLGINGHINDEKKKASVIAFKFLTSKEIHKKLILEGRLNSPISSLYDDEEICSVVDCKFHKSLQLITRPNVSSYSKWSNNFRKNIYEYIYGEKSISDVLKDEDLYLSSSNPKKSFFGLFTLIIIYTIISTFIYY